jgi:hypothetical protein
MAKPAPRVFVSHSHKDDKFTQRLVSDLKAAGADVWVDVVGIDSGDFLKRINDALASREWLVLVLTPDALRSQWVQTEVHAAMNLVVRGRMRQVVPILAKPCNPKEIPPTWDVLHRYDATHDYEAALAGLLRAFGLVSPNRPSAPQSPSAPTPQLPLRVITEVTNAEVPDAEVRQLLREAQKLIRTVTDMLARDERIVEVFSPLPDGPPLPLVLGWMLIAERLAIGLQQLFNKVVDGQLTSAEAVIQARATVKEAIQQLHPGARLLPRILKPASIPPEAELGQYMALANQLTRGLDKIRNLAEVDLDAEVRDTMDRNNE